MRKLNHPGAVMGMLALGLEATGVASGAYAYGPFPLKLMGVPMFVPVMWVLLTYLAYLIHSERGMMGILTVWLLDLVVLEPVAYHLNWWRWTGPYSRLIVPFGTTANAVVWIVMCGLGIALFRNSLDKPVEPRRNHVCGRERSQVKENERKS